MDFTKKELAKYLTDILVELFGRNANDDFVEKSHTIITFIHTATDDEINDFCELLNEELGREENSAKVSVINDYLNDMKKLVAIKIGLTEGA